MVMIYL